MRGLRPWAGKFVSPRRLWFVLKMVKERYIVVRLIVVGDVMYVRPKCDQMPLDLSRGLEADDGGKKARSDTAEMERGWLLILS